ncbi:hypothetical protein L227DRAFT_581776 [Lentinus tigrinus ALCF2SS1-6]|uniref:Uncharacterized protein n=1 Tax=Lentinus tigrinus ALCF2SS1-6 TaxID=1328759 RepID=A0A5C2RPD0_9APHY|nr:hypothetical protein L227DRAFT_581776 [Lentinus tigrinus ALCF2SS1-6]
MSHCCCSTWKLNSSRPSRCILSPYGYCDFTWPSQNNMLQAEPESERESARRSHAHLAVSRVLSRVETDLYIT